MSKSAHPLRRRLVWTAIGLVLTIAAGLAAVSTFALRSTLYDQLDSQLELASDRAASVPADPGPPEDSHGPPGGSKLPLGQAAGTIGVFFDDGRIVDAGFTDDDGEWRSLTDEQRAALEELPTDGEIRSVDVPGLGEYHAIAEVTDDGDPVVTAMSVGAITSTISTYLGVELGFLATGVAIAAIAGTVLVRRTLRPLDHVADAATRVAEVPLDKGAVGEIPRVAAEFTDGRTEVGRVGSAFNRMIGHVETALSARHASEQQVRRFVADASHELRTPLASIRGYAELVRRSPEEVPPATMHALGRIESEASRMSLLVDDLLLLARLDAGRPLDRAPVDLAAVVVDAVADAHAAAPEHQWRLRLDEAAESFEVTGDDARLRQVVGNLLANARVHTPAGTTVTVAAGLDADAVMVRVSDDGPGVPPGLRDSLFDRFSRGDTARTRVNGSTGLGLAITQAIVQAHDGTIGVQSRTATESAAEPGESGTTFTVRLPARTAHTQLIQSAH